MNASMPKLMKSTGLFLATYRLQSQERDRVSCVRVRRTGLDPDGVNEIVRTLAAYNNAPESEIGLVKVERLHEVLELEVEETAVKGKQPAAK